MGRDSSIPGHVTWFGSCQWFPPISAKCADPSTSVASVRPRAVRVRPTRHPLAPASDQSPPSKLATGWFGREPSNEPNPPHDRAKWLKTSDPPRGHGNTIRSVGPSPLATRPAAAGKATSLNILESPPIPCSVFLSLDLLLAAAALF